jgi:acetate kinase
VSKAVLAINAGSSSLKFAAFAVANGDQLALGLRGEIDRIGTAGRLLVRNSGGSALTDKTVQTTGYQDALSQLLSWLDRHAAGLDFAAVGHRVVHGGALFVKPVIVDDIVHERLQELIPLAPLHQPFNLDGITACRKLKPGLIQVACFDTAFHHTMPAVERAFALPYDLTEQGVRRYGFHGLSYDHIASVLPNYLGKKAAARVIVGHLGHGVSLCGMVGLRSVATTMSFTPLDGLPMATRSGSIDPAIVLYLMRAKTMDADSVSDLLHHRSGLLGVSGVSGDMRDLLSSSDPRAEQAIEMFVHRVNREIGSLVAVLGGVDALVFTGGIGEKAGEIRSRICRKAAWLGIKLDDTANTKDEARISDAVSPVSVWVIPTNEELVIARQALALARNEAA